MDPSSSFRLPENFCCQLACAANPPHSHRLNHSCGLSAVVYAVGLVILALIWCPEEVAAEGQHQSDKINLQARSLRLVVQKCIKSPDTYTAEKARFDEYFQTYLFPSMTQTDPKFLGLLGDHRKELLQRYLWASKNNPDLQSDLTKMSFDFTNKVIRDKDYHPAVRLNATLLLGSLDAKYSDQSNEPPTPYPAATQTLLKIVKAAGKSSIVTSPMLAAALIGLERQAQSRDNLPSPVKQEFQQTLLGIVNQPELSKSMDPDVQYWLKRVAASALAELHETGTDNQVVTGLLSLITAPEMPLDDRCQVAVMVTKIPLEGKQVDTDAIAQGLLLLTQTVANKAAEKAIEFEDMRIGKGPGRGNLPGRGMGFKKPEFDRRRILSQLKNLDIALSAIKPLTSEKVQVAVDDVLTALQLVQEAAQNEEVSDLKFTESVRQMAADVSLAAAPVLSEEQDPATHKSQDDLDQDDLDLEDESTN